MGMSRVGSLLLTLMGGVGVWTTFVLVSPGMGLAPALETPHSGLPPLPEELPLEELYAMRDRLQAKLQTPAARVTMISTGIFSAPTETLEQLQAVEIRIQIEEIARSQWQEAINLASEAAELSQAEVTLNNLEERDRLWREAIDLLQEISSQASLHQDVPAKLEEYRTYHRQVAYAYDTARSDFLEEIAETTGLPSDQVHITVCHLEGECRRWNGNIAPASPASLIKLPVAVALMQKVEEENIDLDSKVVVSRGNYTEDASDIWVGAEYTLRRLMMRMINQSSNIATNELIDYVGWDYLNQVMRDRGFPNTFIGYKLVGERTFPSNAGGTPNRMTTDEMTEMMRQIYRQELPGHEVLVDALVSQYDTVLGYQGLRGTTAIWMGEKTGQNSKALGTTYAFQIDQEMYLATIVLDYSANERALRRCVNDIAKHIMANDGLGS